MFGHVVGTYVHLGGGRVGDGLDGHSLAVRAGYTVGLTLGGLDDLDDEHKVGHVGAFCP